MTDIDIDGLIDDAFAGRELTPQAVQSIAEYVAAAGFGEEIQVAAGRRLEGIEWRERRLRPEDRILTAEAHFLRHVVVQKEWPAGTTIEDYQASVASIARQPGAGIFINRFDRMRSIGVVGRSHGWRGEAGAEWMLVELRVSTRHWATAIQIQDGLIYLDDAGREDFRWLRDPE